MSKRLYKLALLGGAILLLLVVGFFQQRLNRQREDPQMGLMRVADLGSNAPPVLAFTTVALGGFRGIIANSLWIRANDLQNDGKYFEMVQLADWITKLQPTFAQVWLMQSWNMAYNISVKFSDPADRWRWVERGIQLLRDDGLRYCPTDALVYRELAWFFQHKMGQPLDDAHLYYKQVWAKQMDALLGSGHPNFAELIDPKTPDAQKRVHTLRETYKMDPRFMQEVDKLYGPLEWRLPEAHAIYWASLGLKAAKKKDLITLRRAVYQSMQQIVLHGHIVSLDPFYFGPDLSKVDQALKTYEQMLADETEKKDAINVAYKNYLKQIVYLLFTNNQEKKAADLFNVLKQKFPQTVPANQPVDEYALVYLAGDIKTLNHDKATSVVEGLIYQHYLSFAYDQDDRATAALLMAQKIYNIYTGRLSREALRLAPFSEMKKSVLDGMVNPQNQFVHPKTAERLRQKLNIPAATSAQKPAQAPAKS
jgi:hypothetical protein